MHSFRHSVVRLLITVASVLVVTLAALPMARAQDEQKTLAIKVEGSNAKVFREWIADMVPDNVNVIADLKFAQALARSGLPGGRMAHALTSPRMKPMILKIGQRAVKRAEIDGAILARVIRGPQLVLIYVEAEGEPLIDTKIDVSGSSDDQKAAIKEALTPVFDELAPAEEEPEEVEEEPEEEPEEEQPKEEEEEEEEEDEPGEFVENQVGSELLNLNLQLQFGGRWFSYSESPANTPNTRTYDVFGVPAMVVGGEIYPAATEKIVVLSDIGLTISYMHSFGLSSETDDAINVFSTSWNQLWAGLTYRLRLGDAAENPPVLNFSGRFGFLNFTLSPEDDAARAIEQEVPSAEYLLLRAGLDMRIPIGEVFALWPSFGYVGPLEGGPVYDRFTDASLAAIDMGLQLAFVLGAGFEIRTGVEYTRVFSSFDPQVGDAYIAGGGLDQQLALRLGAAYVF